MTSIGTRVAGARKNRLILFGDVYRGGTYVLGIRVRRPLKMAFGRFKGGKQILVTPGDYAYVGSALAEQGASCLARRLVRHATRTEEKPPQAIREAMLKTFVQIGLGEGDLRPSGGKHFHWNVDYLLDHICVDLVAAYIVRSPQRIETELGQLLRNDPGTIEFERGLGANDIPGNTHLLRVANQKWWHSLHAKLEEVLRSKAEC